jgi:hypothetical protein
MKASAILFATLLYRFFACAQFPFPGLPTMLIVDQYADTILNNRAILLREGIKEVYAYQTAPDVTKTFASKRVWLNTDGRIEKVLICFAQNKKTNSTLCVQDTIRYDSAARVVEIRTTDNMGNKYPQVFLSYLRDGATKWANDAGEVWRYHNPKGQMVQLRSIWNAKEIQNILFFYNSDGLLDSTRSPYGGTFVFRRAKKGKLKVIKMKNYMARYKWAYNRLGQFVSSVFVVDNNVVRDTAYKKREINTHIHCYYNPDGTLSKITQKSGKKRTITMYYSYSR